MNSEKRTSLTFALTGLILTFVAWSIPSTPLLLQVLVTFSGILIVVWAHNNRYDTTKSWIYSIIASLRVNYALIFSMLLSIGVIIAFSYLPSSNLVTAAQFITTGLLSAILCTLIMSRSNQPAVRIIKGTEDAVFLLERGIKRHIPDPVTLNFIHIDTYRPTEVVSDLELRTYPSALPLPEISSCDLVKIGDNKFVIWEGKRRSIPDDETIKWFFGDRTCREIDDRELDKYKRGGSIPSAKFLMPPIIIQNVTSRTEEQPKVLTIPDEPKKQEEV